MTTADIANVLYNMSLDMDYADYLEYAQDEIAELAHAIDTSASDTLKQCLENIALMHKDYKDLFTKSMNFLNT